jgi:hypothetical protein
VGFDPRSRSLVTRRDLGRFPGESLFDRVARAVCGAGCLPRKELYESWEVARRVRRRVRGHRVVELAAGHALVAHLLLLLDDTSRSALAVDAKPVPSAARLQEALVSRWPRLAGRVERRLGDLSAVPLSADDLVVSVHACGALSDVVIGRAIGARAHLALLPCCHDARTCDTGGLAGFLRSPCRRRHSAAPRAAATTSTDHPRGDHPQPSDPRRQSTLTRLPAVSESTTAPRPSTAR